MNIRTGIKIVDYIVLPPHLSSMLAGMTILNTGTSWFRITVGDTTYPIRTEHIIIFDTKEDADAFAGMFCAGMKCEARWTQDSWHLWSSLHDAVMTYDPSDILNKRCFTFRHINIVINKDL